jgi:hypothetical protein
VRANGLEVNGGEEGEKELESLKPQKLARPCSYGQSGEGRCDASRCFRERGLRRVEWFKTADSTTQLGWLRGG